ncbi:MAG: N-formylglutamate deformylase [Betaproteobacteria bacterium]
MTESIYSLQRGTRPLLISVPHVGTRIPVDQKHRYLARALDVEDTDWHLEHIYAFAKAMGAGLIVPRYSRFLIDLNRSADNTPMYAGANNTELCPTRFFTGEPIYLEGLSPDGPEMARRREVYWQPYHDAVAQELDRLKAAHGHAVLFDGHSIKSTLPWLFEGKLPDLNLGTANGASCAPDLRAELMGVLQRQERFTQVTDGRFKGGHITRHYGRPDDGIHAIQLEMCWNTYMLEAPPYALEPTRVAQLEPTLRALVQSMLDWRPHA